MKKLKKLPSFKNEDEERKFWDTHSSVDYVDWSKAVIMRFPNLKPSTETISLRLPKWLLDEIKMKANWRDMPYQSFIKAMLVEKNEELSNSFYKSSQKSYSRVMEKRKKYKV